MLVHHCLYAPLCRCNSVHVRVVDVPRGIITARLTPRRIERAMTVQGSSLSDDHMRCAPLQQMCAPLPREQWRCNGLHLPFADVMQEAAQSPRKEVVSMMSDGNVAGDEKCAPLHRVHHCLDSTVVRCTGHHVRLRARCGNNRTWQAAPRRSERAMTEAEPIVPGQARRSRRKRPCWQRGVHMKFTVSGLL